MEVSHGSVRIPTRCPHASRQGSQHALRGDHQQDHRRAGGRPSALGSTVEFVRFPRTAWDAEERRHRPNLLWHQRAHAFADAASWLVDQERCAAFTETGAHHESRYYLTLLYLPPPDHAGRAERWLYERQEGSGPDTDAWGQLEWFSTETDRALELLSAILPEAEALSDAETRRGGASGRSPARRHIGADAGVDERGGRAFHHSHDVRSFVRRSAH